MNDNASPYFLFPHTLLFEAHYRHLSLLLPELSILQVARPSEPPGWGRDQFSLWPAIRDDEKVEQVKAYLNAYQNLADMYGGEGFLASLTQHWTKNDPLQESRFRIQSMIRGQGLPDEKDIKEWLFLEAAVFLELARDLDEKEKELEFSISRLDRLEEEFREIVGITDNEELEEEVSKTMIPSLAPSPDQLAFMIPKRIACWYRIAASRWTGESFPYLVAIKEEVVEELLEPVLAEKERENKPLDLLQTDLAAIPSLHRLSPEAFLILKQELETSDFLASYRQNLEKAIENPDDASLHETLTASAKTLSKYVELFCRKNDVPQEGQISLKLTHLKDCTHGELWKKLDKAGYEELGGTLPTTKGISLLYLKSTR